MVEARKVSKLKKINVADLLKTVLMPTDINKILLGKSPKDRPFKYMEDITKEKFLAVKGLGPKKWEMFEMIITHCLEHTKFELVRDRLVKQIFGKDVPINLIDMEFGNN